MLGFRRCDDCKGMGAFPTSTTARQPKYLMPEVMNERKKNHRSQCNFDVLDQTAVFARSYCGVDLRLCSFGITHKSPSKLNAWFLQHVLMSGGLGETSSAQWSCPPSDQFRLKGFEASWFSKNNGAHVHNISLFNKQW